MNNWFQKSIISKEKNCLMKSLQKSEAIRLNNIEANRNIWVDLQKSGINNYDEFYNVCLYSSIVYNDISILLDNYHTCESSSQKNLFGRLLCMTIIEFLDDINELIGKNLRQELESNDMSEYLVKLKVIGKEFSTIKRENNTALRRIRNNSAAHKTKIAKDLINFTTEIPFDGLNEIAIKVSLTNKKLTELSTKIILKITESLRIQFEQRNIQL